MSIVDYEAVSLLRTYHGGHQTHGGGRALSDGHFAVANQFMQTTAFVLALLQLLTLDQRQAERLRHASRRRALGK